MIIKTSELEGAALDWAVAKSQGDHCVINAGFFENVRFSTGWAQGGPLLDERIVRVETHPMSDEPWLAWADAETPAECGRSLLIAAMRAIVATDLGDEVNVPDELAMDRRREKA